MSTAQKSLSPAAWTMMIALALIWGNGFVAIGTLLDHVSPLHAISHRVLWSALALWAYILIARRPLPRGAGVWAALVVTGFLSNALPFVLQAWAQTVIPTGLAAILNATTAIFGALVAALVFADERLTARKGLGILMGFAGVVTIIGLRALGAFDPSSIAQLAMLGSTFSYALGASWARRMHPGLSPDVATAGMLGGAALIVVPLALIVEGPLPMNLGLDGWIAAGYVTLINSAVAFLLYYRIMATAGASNTMLVTLMVPPIAIVMGALLRDETLPLRAFAGLGLIVAGLLVIDPRLTAGLRARITGRRRIAD